MAEKYAAIKPIPSVFGGKGALIPAGTQFTAKLVAAARVAANVRMANIEELYKRLAPRAKYVVWTTTTPCPNVTTSMGRTDAKVVAYNERAARVLANKSVTVDDLHSAVVAYCGKDYKSCDLQKPANVHFEPKGCQFLADHVVAVITRLLSVSV